jgi:hypothetical protein
VPTYEGWLFLAAVMDLYSRKVVGWSMREDLEAPLVVDAISMAIARRRPAAGLVHHSDRGLQYTSIAMGRTLRDSKIMASMGSRGDPWDNASAESCISTIKNELVKRRSFRSRDQARLALFRYIEAFYNPLRRHSSLEMLSPDEHERQYWKDQRRGSRRLEKPCQRKRGNLNLNLSSNTRATEAGPAAAVATNTRPHKGSERARLHALPDHAPTHSQLRSAGRE